VKAYGPIGSVRTYIGGIHAGSTLAQVRHAFVGYSLTLILRDFGQGSDGVVVGGPAGGFIGISLEPSSQSQFKDGSALVSYVNGVGVSADYAPSPAETGC
jgi:hypothetical protein